MKLKLKVVKVSNERVMGKTRRVLTYKLIDYGGELKIPSKISLDMEYILPSLGGASRKWHNLHFDEHRNLYCFQDKHETDYPQTYSLHEEIVELIQQLVLEEALLGKKISGTHG